MNVIHRLYREYFFLYSLYLNQINNLPATIMKTLLGAGNVIYDDDPNDDEIVEMMEFIRQYVVTNEVPPLIAQLYFLHLKHNMLDSLASLPDTKNTYQFRNSVPTFSYAVDIGRVARFYKTFSTKKFRNNIKLPTKI